MRRSRGVSTFVATMLLISITLSLAYAVYEGVSRFAPPREEVFANELVAVGGTEPMTHIVANSSAQDTPVALELGNVSSLTGILYFDGMGYATTRHLCLTNGTTFFAVKTGPGVLEANADGPIWIDGRWTSSVVVGAGWHEVMFVDAGSCSLTGPGGVGLVYPGPAVSTVPIIGEIPSASCEFYLPSGNTENTILLVFQGGYDRIA